MPPDVPAVAVTGAEGFVGRSLRLRLGEKGWPVAALARATPLDEARAALQGADVVIHLAAAIRPQDPADFDRADAYAAWVAGVIAKGGQRPLVILASSVKAEGDDAYARGKRAAEAAFLGLAGHGGATAAIWRLPNVFGKWARPDYNSAVATFCHNLARGLPIRVDDPQAPLSLLHVDDLIDQWLAQIVAPPQESGYFEPAPLYESTVGQVAAMIGGFAAGRIEGRVGHVGTGLERALYATFIAALPQAAFSYPLQAHTDARGGFTEMLKTPSSGQFSMFTAHPGVTRGGHYHHSKVEKFLIVQGEALFRFRHVLSGAAHAVRTSGDSPVVVETIPGWTHDVTNVGEGTLICLLWANEVFDRARPDTVALPV